MEGQEGAQPQPQDTGLENIADRNDLSNLNSESSNKPKIGEYTEKQSPKPIEESMASRNDITQNEVGITSKITPDNYLEKQSPSNEDNLVGQTEQSLITFQKQELVQNFFSFIDKIEFKKGEWQKQVDEAAEKVSRYIDQRMKGVDGKPLNGDAASLSKEALKAEIQDKEKDILAKVALNQEVSSEEAMNTLMLMSVESSEAQSLREEGIEPKQAEAVVKVNEWIKRDETDKSDNGEVSTKIPDEIKNDPMFNEMLNAHSLGYLKGLQGHDADWLRENFSNLVPVGGFLKDKNGAELKPIQLITGKGWNELHRAALEEYARTYPNKIMGIEQSRQYKTTLNDNSAPQKAA